MARKDSPLTWGSINEGYSREREAYVVEKDRLRSTPRFRSRADRRAAMEFMRLGVACKTLMYTASYNFAIAA